MRVAGKPGGEPTSQGHSSTMSLNRRLVPGAASARFPRAVCVSSLPSSTYNAELKFQRDLAQLTEGKEDPECQSGLVLLGLLKPVDCPAFGIRCTPEQPLGAPMVSSEGACAAYYRYRGQVKREA